MHLRFVQSCDAAPPAVALQEYFEVAQRLRPALIHHAPTADQGDDARYSLAALHERFQAFVEPRMPPPSEPYAFATKPRYLVSGTPERPRTRLRSGVSYGAQPYVSPNHLVLQLLAIMLRLLCTVRSRQQLIPRLTEVWEIWAGRVRYGERIVRVANMVGGMMMFQHDDDPDTAAQLLHRDTIAGCNLVARVMQFLYSRNGFIVELNRRLYGIVRFASTPQTADTLPETADTFGPDADNVRETHISVVLCRPIRHQRGRHHRPSAAAFDSGQRPNCQHD